MKIQFVLALVLMTAIAPSVFAEGDDPAPPEETQNAPATEEDLEAAKLELEAKIAAAIEKARVETAKKAADNAQADMKFFGTCITEAGGADLPCVRALCKDQRKNLSAIGRQACSELKKLEKAPLGFNTPRPPRF